MNEFELKDLIAIVALVVAMIALIKDPLVAWIFGPRLHVEFDQTNGADLHQIPVNHYADAMLVAQTPAYFARLRVFNTGWSTAEMVELSVIELYRRDVSGTYLRSDTFLPLNLKWSHIGTTYRERIPQTVMKYCDLFHIWKPGLPYSTSSLVAVLELEVQRSSGTGRLQPGFYKLVVQIAAANARATNVTFYLSVPSTWADNVAGMVTNGFYLTT